MTTIRVRGNEFVRAYARHLVNGAKQAFEKMQTLKQDTAPLTYRKIRKNPY